MEGKNNFVFQNLPSSEKLIELWLPQYTEFRLKVLHLDDSSSFTPYNDQRPKWTTYGSSITHCSGAEKPSDTWPGIVSRNHGLNLTCLGYGGNCHLEPQPNLVGSSLEDFRVEIANTVRVLQNHGDSNIHYIDGLNLFGPEYIHLLPDELHPNGEGYKVIGDKFLSEVAQPFFKK